MHNLVLPKVGLQLVPSTYEPATPEAVQAGLDYAARGGKEQNRSLFRMCDHSKGGAESWSQDWVCVATNRMREKELSGGCVTFIYPGFPHPNTAGMAWASQYSSGAYNYPLPSENPIPFEWLKFILDPEVSPWRLVLPFVVNLDPVYCYEHRCIQFQEIDALPFRVWQSFLIGARLPYEKPGKALTWWNLVKNGIPKNYAYLMGSIVMSHDNSDDPVMKTQTYGGHEALDSPGMTAHGFMTGEFREGSKGSAFLKDERRHRTYPGALNYWYALGFTGPEDSAINSSYKKVVACMPGDRIKLAYLVEISKMLTDPTYHLIELEAKKNLEAVKPDIKIRRAKRVIQEDFDLDL